MQVKVQWGQPNVYLVNKAWCQAQLHAGNHLELTCCSGAATASVSSGPGFPCMCISQLIMHAAWCRFHGWSIWKPSLQRGFSGACNTLWAHTAGLAPVRALICSDLSSQQFLQILQSLAIFKSSGPMASLGSHYPASSKFHCGAPCKWLSVAIVAVGQPLLPAKSVALSHNSLVVFPQEAFSAASMAGWGKAPLSSSGKPGTKLHVFLIVQI